MFLVDSHCHLDLIELSAENQSIDELIKRAQEKGIGYILNVCVSLENFPNMLKTIENYSQVGASVGLHPNEPEQIVDAAHLIQLAQHPKVIAIGETGLDYFRSSGNLDWQRERFRTHIQAAKESQKPLIIHTREAKEDTLRLMHEERADEIGGVMHCFTEDWETAKKALEMNFYISFSGIITFKTAVTIQEVARRLPLDRILIETDAPYLAPHPKRGKQNEPSFIHHTAEFIAHLRQSSLEEIAEGTTNNFFNLFKGAERPHV